MSFHKVPLKLTEAQFHKLRKGHPVQLKHHQLTGDEHWIACHPETAKKLHTAKHKQKGVRIQLTNPELEASGEGIKEFWDKLKNAGKWVKEKIIDTPFYQTNVKPIVRGLVNTGETMVQARLGPLGGVATSAIEAIGKKSGAYGLVKVKRSKCSSCKGGSFIPAGYPPGYKH